MKRLFVDILAFLPNLQLFLIQNVPPTKNKQTKKTCKIIFKNHIYLSFWFNKSSTSCKTQKHFQYILGGNLSIRDYNCFISSSTFEEEDLLLTAQTLNLITYLKCFKMMGGNSPCNMDLTKSPRFVPHGPYFSCFIRERKPCSLPAFNYPDIICRKTITLSLKSQGPQTLRGYHSNHAGFRPLREPQALELRRPATSSLLLQRTSQLSGSVTSAPATPLPPSVSH